MSLAGSVVDVLSLVKAELLGRPTAVFSKSPTPLHLTLTVANLLQHDLVADTSNSPVIQVKVSTVYWVMKC